MPENGNALRSRIMRSHALCAVAESEIHSGHMERALRTVRSLRGLMAEIAPLIDQPHSAFDSRDASDLLAELETRLRAIEGAIPPK
jgi:hypothetical protein